MQRHPAQSVDPAYVDALVLRARRERSEYIFALVAAAGGALRRRLARIGHGHGHNRFHGRVRSA